MHHVLDVSLVPVDVRRQFQKYFDDGDGRGIVFLVGGNSLRFVLDNVRALKARGIYEPRLSRLIPTPHRVGGTGH